MKKITLLSTAIISILAAVSCSRDSYKESIAPDTIHTTISARLESTKTALGDKDGVSYPNYWKSGDQISVNGIVSEALDAGADGKASADFTFASVVTTPYCAAYPAAAVSGYSAGSATLTLPSVQNYVEGSYDPAAFIMGGTSSNPESVSLTPFVSIFHLTLTGSASISSVKLTGAPEAALSGSFTTDFTTFTPGVVSNVVEMAAGSPVALPAEFFICIPPSVSGSFKIEAFDSEGGSMSKTATIKSALSAGQMYSASTTYSGSFNPVITAEGVTSSTAVICWSNSPETAYTIGVYSDAGCSSLLDSYEVPTGDACWGGTSPRFCISGLEPGTTYYVKVTNVAHSADSNILPVTTADFSIVEVSDDPADVDEVILAEDFGELRWDCDVIGAGAGWFPTSAAQATSFASFEVDSYRSVGTASEKQLSPQTGPLAGSRLMHWAQGENKNIYIHPGYLKLVGEKKVTHIVTPALNSIPGGKLATLEVEVTASAYYSESSGSFCTTNAVVAVQSGVFSELVGDATNSLDLTGKVAAVTLSEESAWNTYKVILDGVSHGDRLAFGAASGVSGNDARMNISDIKVTIKALNSPGDLVAAVENVSSSTASFSWTHIGEDAAFDVSKPYTASLYSDSGRSSLVVSHNLEAEASYWSGKSPCFSFGGLTPSTTYWFVVTDTDSDTVSNVVEFTTAAFTPVDATTVSDAAAGDVLLAEDFGEIAAGPDEFAGAAGFIPAAKNLLAPSGINPEGDYIASDNTGHRIFGSGWDLGDSRLSHGWGFFGNSSVFLRNAYLRISTTGSTNRTHLVTPRLGGIPEGKLATIEVTVTATKHESNENDIAVFVEKDLALNGTSDPTSASYKKYTGAALSDGHALGITGVKEWETRTVTVSNVDNECQLVIGSLENISGKNRFSISDVKVTITGLADDPVKKIKDNATFVEFVSAVAGGDKTLDARVSSSFELTSASAAAFESIEDYEGTFDGNGKTITGLTKPMFNELKGTVKDLTLNSTLDITADQADLGILANILSGTVDGCTSRGSVTFNVAAGVTGEHRIGGMIGLAASSGASVTHCTNEASVTNSTSNTGAGELLMGGIVGNFWGTEFHISDCENTGDITNAANWAKAPIIGGIIGQGGNSSSATSDFSISSCSNSGAISNSGSTGDSVQIGGIAGFTRFLNLTSCTNSGTVSNTGAASSYVYVGGLLGYVASGAQNTIDSSSNEGAVSNTANAGNTIEAGGIAGFVRQTTMTTLTNTGAVFNSGIASGTSSTSGVFIGGLIGFVERDCTMTETTVRNRGDVTNSGSGKLVALGGIFGRNTGGAITATGTSSKYLQNEGSISDESSSDASDLSVGGIVGSTTTGIKLQYARNYGDVKVLGGTRDADVEVGGIAGWLNNNALNVNNCRNYGDVTVSAAITGSLWAGGIVGLFHVNHKTDKYNLYFGATVDTHLATVTGENYTAGLFGLHSGTGAATYIFNGLKFDGAVIGNKTKAGLLCNSANAGTTVTFKGSCQIAPGSSRKDDTNNDTVNEDSDLTMDVICGYLGSGSSVSGVSVEAF